MELDKIPNDFIKKNLSQYQKRSIEIKYTIHSYFENHNGNIMDGCIELSKTLHLDSVTIKDIYYKVRRCLSSNQHL